jgi:putative membrane protein
MPRPAYCPGGYPSRVTNTAHDEHGAHGDSRAQPEHDEHPAHLARSRTSWRSGPASAVRGGLVGAAESVPGISGGTIALVVGLYDDLIDAAGQLLHALRELVTGVVRRRGVAPALRALRAVDWALLVPVLVGMVVVLLLSLRLIAPLLESHPVPVRAVFFGMIVVSVAVPLRLMPARFRPLDGLLLAVAAVAGFLLTSLPPGQVDDPSLWLVALGAAVAINALVLPGVSGSFVLLAMGLYVPVQEAVSERDLAFVGAFALGAVVGLGSFVKLLQWLLHHRRQVTMAVLAGLMVGSLRALWPWQEDDGALLAPTGSVAGPVLLAVAGAAVVVVAMLWEARVARRAQPRT